MAVPLFESKRTRKINTSFPSDAVMAALSPEHVRVSLSDLRFRVVEPGGEPGLDPGCLRLRFIKVPARLRKTTSEFMEQPLRPGGHARQNEKAGQQEQNALKNLEGKDQVCRVG